MAHPFLNKLFPVLEDIERHKDDVTQNESRAESKRDDPVKERVLWRENPFWVINLPYYLLLIAVASALIYGAYEDFFVQPVVFLSAVIAVISDIVTQLIAMIDKGFQTSKWRLSPSQVENWLNLYPLPVILAILFLAALKKFLYTKIIRYEVTPTRIVYAHGLFDRTGTEAFLYEVKNHRLKRRFWQRLFGRSEVLIQTNDEDFGERTFVWINGKLLKRHLDFYVHGESIKMPAGQLITPDSTTYHHEAVDSD